ncbi:hypothetical protein AB0K12_17160 [Nonomuraea sp. NPDC049419]|uniref:hypothetical protein n=1 Tax=Nonomuraea sp. NPDC049419 TaxID=3155772 RepID=UPI00344A8096
MENTDLAQVAAQIGADPASGVMCKWEDLARGLDIGENTRLAWMGSINNSWTQIVGDPTPFDALPALSAGNRRALRVAWTVDGVHDIYYAVGGHYVTAFGVTKPDARKGQDPHALDSYATGLQFDIQDASWESDPDLLPGWHEYSAWKETLYDLPDDDMVDDAYESMPPEWSHLLDLSLNGYSPQLATCITSALILVGRVTGRELDETWMEGHHTRYTIS